MNRVIKFFTQLVTTHLDVKTSAVTPTYIMDLFYAIAPLARGRSAGKKPTVAWNTAWAPMLASAVNGGQWTQTRKA